MSGYCTTRIVKIELINKKLKRLKLQNYQVKLIEYCVVFGQVLVSVHPLLLEVFPEKRTVDGLVLSLLHRLASRPPLLKPKPLKIILKQIIKTHKNHERSLKILKNPLKIISKSFKIIFKSFKLILKISLNKFECTIIFWNNECKLCFSFLEIILLKRIQKNLKMKVFQEILYSVI